MTMNLYDPKNLGEWLRLDYFRRPRAFGRWLRRLSWSVLAGALLWVGWSLWPENHTVYQSGPLTSSHALFQQDCQKCHTAHFQPLARLWLGDAGVHSVSDQTCRKCHPGPAHQTSPFVSSSNCAACHREHSGRDRLAFVADASCTKCHASLQEHHSHTRFRNVNDFTSHPEFALWKAPKDPGTVRFNHKRHLNLKVDEVRGIKEQVRLLRTKRCNYCHQPDNSGRYMRPISYDKHCGSCHPLQVRVVERQGEMFPPKLRKEALQFAKTPILHPRAGQAAGEVRAFVHNRFLAFAQSNAKLLKLIVAKPARTIPGSRRGRPVTKEQWTWLNSQIRTAERLLFDGADGCRRCHQEKTTPELRKNGLPDFGKPHVPRRWYKHSFFGHEKHRMLRCTECHSQALTSEKTSDVLMPKIANCQKCHAPDKGARHDCVECHTFHQRKVEVNWRGHLGIDNCTR